jgi:hypothetical protein
VRSDVSARRRRGKSRDDNVVIEMGVRAGDSSRLLRLGEERGP